MLPVTMSIVLPKKERQEGWLVPRLLVSEMIKSLKPTAGLEPATFAFFAVALFSLEVSGS